MKARDEQIMVMRQEGKTCAEIGKRFGIGRNRVSQIVARVNRRMFAEVVSSSFVPRFRDLDDPDDKWNRDVFLAALGFTTRLRNRLAHRMPEQSSFRDLVSVLAERKISPYDGQIYMDTPFSIPGFGASCLRELHGRLSALPLGERCSRLWREQLSVLLNNSEQARRILPSPNPMEGWSWMI